MIQLIKCDLGLFSDKIFNLNIAREFTKMTNDKKRKNMSNEAYKIFVRRTFKKIVKKETYTPFAANFSTADVTFENKRRIGKILDAIFNLIEKEGTNQPLGKKCDDIIKEIWPQLLRKRT